jgi:hypothetical protein
LSKGKGFAKRYEFNYEKNIGKKLAPKKKLFCQEVKV